jgi:hypothetical protein
MKVKLHYTVSITFTLKIGGLSTDHFWRQRCQVNTDNMGVLCFGQCCGYRTDRNRIRILALKVLSNEN